MDMSFIIFICSAGAITDVHQLYIKLCVFSSDTCFYLYAYVGVSVVSLGRGSKIDLNLPLFGLTKRFHPGFGI